MAWHLLAVQTANRQRPGLPLFPQNVCMKAFWAFCWVSQSRRVLKCGRLLTLQAHHRTGSHREGLATVRMAQVAAGKREPFPHPRPFRSPYSWPPCVCIILTARRPVSELPVWPQCPASLFNCRSVVFSQTVVSPLSPLAT